MAARKPKIQAVPNEVIISAMLQQGTIQKAAEVTGITPRAVYERMKSREFRAAYYAAKNDLVRSAVYSINQKLSEAIEVVAEIMSDKKISAQTRLQAAQVIITNSGRFADRLSHDEGVCIDTFRSPFELDFEMPDFEMPE